MVTQTFEITPAGSLTGVDKIDVLDWGTIQSLPMSSLVSFEYNRPVRDAHWKKIAKNFNPSECDALVVNRRTDGTLALIDGQHRKMALIGVFGPEATWPCRVVRGLTFQQEAQMFGALNEQRRPVTVDERFRAALLAGDATALEIQAIVESAGFQIAHGLKQTRSLSSTIGAVGTLAFIYHNYSPATLSHVLGIIGSVYGTKVGPTSSMIRALATFCSIYRESYDEDRLKLVLSRLPMSAWERESKEFRRVIPCVPEAAARHILVKHYNKGLRNKLSNTAEIG